MSLLKALMHGVVDHVQSTMLKVLKAFSAQKATFKGLVDMMSKTMLFLFLLEAALTLKIGSPTWILQLLSTQAAKDVVSIKDFIMLTKEFLLSLYHSSKN
jgi:hypothetical protein